MMFKLLLINFCSNNFYHPFVMLQQDDMIINAASITPNKSECQQQLLKVLPYSLWGP